MDSKTKERFCKFITQRAIYAPDGIIGFRHYIKDRIRTEKPNGITLKDFDNDTAFELWICSTKFFNDPIINPIIIAKKVIEEGLDGYETLNSKTELFDRIFEYILLYEENTELYAINFLKAHDPTLSRSIQHALKIYPCEDLNSVELVWTFLRNEFAENIKEVLDDLWKLYQSTKTEENNVEKSKQAN